jgi:hypothetical protein
MAAYQFTFQGSRADFKYDSYGEFLFSRYLRWCERKNVEPSGSAEDYKGI